MAFGASARTIKPVKARIVRGHQHIHIWYVFKEREQRSDEGESEKQGGPQCSNRMPFSKYKSCQGDKALPGDGRVREIKRNRGGIYAATETK
ncbi:hypothetical protein BLL41_19255 [Bacillus sp. FMQ74]|nr:hypothetical protein BLL41_19255 [Bacillus sp. FMQ74]